MTLALPTDETGAAAVRYTARRVTLDDAFVAAIARSAATAFATPAFLAALFDTVGTVNKAEPVLIGVSDAAGRPVALFPFTLRRTGGLRRIEGLGFGVADYYTPILAGPADPEALWRAVRRALPPADLVRLSNVPPELYGEAHALTAARFLRPMGHGSTILTLRPGGRPVDPDSFSAARDVRRKLKKLEAIGPVVCFRGETDAEKAGLMSALLRFREDRFGKLGRADKLDEPGIADFYLRLLDSGVAEIWGLTVGGETVAVVYGLRHRGVFTLIIPTMTAETRYEAGSPGLVSMFMTIARCIAAGDRVFDFSLGALHYKTRFGADKLELHEHVEARSLLGVVPALTVRARSAARVWRQRHPRAEALWAGFKAKLRDRVAAPPA